MSKNKLAIIVAMDQNRVIGKDGGIPWHFPGDLRRFATITKGHPVIMGRKTYESIGRPLKGRLNIVLSRSGDFYPEGCIVCPNFQAALHAAWECHSEYPFVIGGSRLYEEALPLASHLFITHVKKEFEGDTYFPDYDKNYWVQYDPFKSIDIDNENIVTKNYIHKSIYEDWIDLKNR